MEERKNKLQPVKENKIGIVSNFFEHVNVAALRLENSLKLGDKIRVVGGENTDFEQEVESMQVQGKDVEQVKAGDDVGIKMKEKVRKGYKVYRI